MNKLLIGPILLSMLITVPGSLNAHEMPGASHRLPSVIYSHDQRRYVYSRDYYARDRKYDHHWDKRRDKRHGKRHKRQKDMPGWLYHNRSFRHWLAATGLEKNRYMSWYELFDLYLWERRNRRFYW